MNFNDLILLLDSRLENLKQLSSMEIPYKVDGDGTEFFKTKDGYRIEDHGFIEWRNKMDVVHRTDGPAFEHPNGSKEWWVHGKQMSEEQFNQWRAKNNPIKESRSENLKQLSSMEIPFRVDNDGTEVYKTKDGYRLEYADGDMAWYDNNWSYHRVDGPAYINADGRKSWWLNGNRHRTDGPAIEWADGDKSWYINDKKMTEEQFNKWRAKHNPIKESREENLKQLASMEVPYKVSDAGFEYYKTKDGYRIEDAEGGMAWYNRYHLLHRLDGPAVIKANGDKAWSVNGKYHRTDGPAIEWADGGEEWYIHDRKMTEEQFNQWRAKNNPIK